MKRMTGSDCMNEFIVLHNMDGDMICLNLAHIIEFYYFDGCVRVVTTIDYECVKESFDEIIKIIRGGQNAN